LQQNLNRSTFFGWEMKRKVSVVCVCFVAISLLVLELLKKWRVWQRMGHPVYFKMLSLLLRDLDLTVPGVSKSCQQIKTVNWCSSHCNTHAVIYDFNYFLCNGVNIRFPHSGKPHNLSVIYGAG
jgi:hypothetical protein